nr:MAG: RNA-dependent RNA polymerase [Wufeng shrew picorna-like virus 23]
MALRREVLLELAQGELSNYDQDQEDLWTAITSMFETVRSKLTESITGILSSVIKLAEGYFPAITAIVSSVVTLLTSIVTLAIQYNSTAVKVALGAGILASLTSFISNVSLLFKPLGDWNSLAAQAAAVELTAHVAESISQQPDVVANSLDYKVWITMGVTSLVAILFAGIGLTGSVAWRDLITGSNVLEGIKKTSNNIQNVADFVLRDLVGIELDRDYPQCLVLEKLAEEGSRLQQLSVAQFVQLPDELYKLKTYVNKIVAATSQRISTESSRRYGTVRQLLVVIYKQLSDKLDAVNAILSTKPRQVTVGLMLSGPPGHGKSEFGKYICKRVARALGYPDQLYCLNKKADGFYEPYGGSAIGVFNEFMAMRSEDAILRDLNLILSSDPMNFEAACIEGKSQPCQLKLVFLTSNSHNPEIIRVLSEGAVKATWDRIYHIAVEDPLCKGRHHPNIHRKPDFSHLQFNLVKHNSPDNITMSDIDLRTIEERLIGRCAVAERDFIREVLLAEPDRDVATSLLDRSRALGDLVLRCQPYDMARSNALGREFFVTRLQGVPGSGKSTLAEQLARECAGLFSFPIQYSRVEAEFIPIVDPCIYVMDDWIEEHNVESYVQKMNQTHEKSMFFVTSNTIINRLSFRADPYGSMTRLLTSFVGLGTATPWDASSSCLPPGAFRRIGLQGFIRIPGGAVVQTPEIFQRTFTFGENFVVRDAYNTVGNYSMILDLIFRSFRTFLALPTQFVIIEGLPPAMRDPGVTLEAPSAKALIEGLRSPAMCMAAYMGRANGFKLLVSDRLTGPSATSQTMVNTWLVVEEPSDDPDVLRSVWSRMCATFGRTFPGESLLLHLLDTQSTYYYEGGVSYHYGPNIISRTIPVEILDDAIIYYRDANTPIRVTAAEFAGARLYNQYSGPMLTCTASEYRAINRALTGTLTSNPSCRFAIYYKLEESRAKATYSSKALWLRATLKKNPIFWIGASLLSVVCVGGALFGFIRLCQTIHYHLTSSPTTANTSPPSESKGYHPARDILRRIATQNSDGPRESKGPKPAQLALRKLRANDFSSHSDYGWTSPPYDATPEAAIIMLERIRADGINAEYALKDLLNSNPEYLEVAKYHPDISGIYANMLRMEDMVKSPPSDIEKFHESIRKAYVHVSSNEGSCYGIHLMSNLILTVSHMFTKTGEDAVIRHDGTSYRAVVVNIDRDRDLSVIRVTDRLFPALPNTRKFFPTSLELSLPKYGFFLRCGPVCQAMGGLITYYQRTTIPITSSENPNYNLNSKLIVHIAPALDKTKTFIRMGDCGFPLVAPINNSMKITGIHNGYNQTEKSYYSSFTSEDFDEFISKATVTPNIRPYSDNAEELKGYEIIAANHSGLLPVAYAEAIEKCDDDYRYSHYGKTLHILGYSSTLAIRSTPKDKYKSIESDVMQTERLTLPAAFTMKYVTETCSLARTSYDVPSPLFTQCLKYDATQQPSFDNFIFEEAIGLVMQDCVSRYGGCRFLRMHETLNGINDSPLPPIDTRTSAGPLLKVLYGIQTKVDLLDCVQPESGRQTLLFRKTPPAQMVKKHYKTYYKALTEQYLPPIIISKDCAKVELIDADKASAGKVRLFNEVDFSINLLLRSIFGDFASKVMSKHDHSPIRMGQNPYLASTHIARQFNEIAGTIVSTDFSAFDKQLPLELIHAFCFIVSRCCTDSRFSQVQMDKIFAALARSLTYVIHTCKGTLYLVDRGNESGTFVTTLLNSVSVDVLTSYTLCRKWFSIFKFIPSFCEVSRHCRKAILGDDRSLKVSYELPVTVEDLIQDSALFCLKCTPAKTSSGLDFCSRAILWDDVDQISYPALKVSSVTSQLHWTLKITEEQLIENCDNSLFEAALHVDPALFNACLTDALSILRKYQIPLERLSFHSRDLIRTRFRAYVRNGGRVPHLEDRTFAPPHDDPVTYVYKTRRAHDIVEHMTYFQLLESSCSYEELLYIFQPGHTDIDFSAFTSKFTQDFIASDPKSYLIKFLQNYGLSDRPEVEFSVEGSCHVCHVFLYGVSAIGMALTKRLAERSAYLNLLYCYFPPFSKEGVRVKQNNKLNITGNIEPQLDYGIIDDPDALSIDYSLSQYIDYRTRNAFEPFYSDPDFSDPYFGPLSSEGPSPYTSSGSIDLTEDSHFSGTASSGSGHV